ncbi:AIR synthase-related protein [Streptomyces sp. LUP47B]|uniref:AIR synthase-related protein n=1 Tax=Streptomyces sp. LUP47B TaxID=1890286 RepID=UPI0008519583|nr:AIR synthase-related protein [Streptomyces sp. LUP47B]
MGDERQSENRQLTLDDDAYGSSGGLAWALLGEPPVAEPAPVTDPAVASGSYAVDPPFFGDGDIGRLAVCATVNDLAAAGAEPRWITLSLTVEAGMPIALLRRVLLSAQDAAREAEVEVRGLETRVVRAGDANRLFAHTTALGTMRQPPVRAQAPAPGDLLLLTSSLGGWAVHLLSVREGLGLENLVPSGCHPLNTMLRDVLGSVAPGAVRQVHRLARGGLARVLRRQATAGGRTVRITEEALPIQHEVGSAAELLGLDPLHTTDEGCLCLSVSADAADVVRDALRAHPYGQDAAVIGEVTDAVAPVVLLVERSGRARHLDLGADLRPEPARLR